MRVLLIQPNLSVEDRYGNKLGKVGPTTEPLGLAYLASAIRNASHYVNILDMEALRYKNKEFIGFLEEHKFDVFGISMLTPTYLRSLEVIKTIKMTDPKSKIVVGGAHVTILPKETLEDNREIDVGIIGEGEITIVELLDAFCHSNDFKNIKGIIYRKNNEIIINKPRAPIMNLDDLPLPARDLLPIKMYTPTPTYYKKLPCYVMITSRGCPYRCAYCSKISGKLYRTHSVERVIKEILVLINKYKAKEIIFRDDTFTINRDRIVILCEEIINKKINKKIKWTCMTRVNLVDKELLKLMKKAGCWSVHYGIESGNQRLLDIIHKDITLEQARNAVKWTKEAKIDVKTFFMIGLPTETKTESVKTINFAKELDPDAAQFTITVPYPGTKLYKIAKKTGSLKKFKWEDYQTWAGFLNKELVYITKGRSSEELKSMQRSALKEFYFRPRIILRQALKLRSWRMFKKQANAAIALFTIGPK